MVEIGLHTDRLWGEALRILEGVLEVVSEHFDRHALSFKHHFWKSGVLAESFYCESEEISGKSVLLISLHQSNAHVVYKLFSALNNFVINSLDLLLIKSNLIL
jgi:hypothetical protein